MKSRPCLRFAGDPFAKRMGTVFTEILADMVMKVDDGQGEWPRGMIHTSTTPFTKPNYYHDVWSRDAGRGLYELARYGMQEEAEMLSEYILSNRVHGDHWGRIVNHDTGEAELDGNTHLLMGIWRTWQLGGKKASFARHSMEKCEEVFGWFRRSMDECPVGDLIPCASELSGMPETACYAIFPNYGAWVSMQAFAELAASCGMHDQANQLSADADRLYRAMLNSFTRDSMWRNGLMPDGSFADTGKFCETYFDIHYWTRQLPFIQKGDLTLHPSYLPEENQRHIASYREILNRMAQNAYFRKYGFVSCTCWAGIGPRHDDTMAGYGQNYMTQAALLMEDVNVYGKCLEGISRLAYDGNVVRRLSHDNSPWIMGECFSYDRYESGEDHTYATDDNPGDEGNLVQSAETLKSLALTLGLEGTQDGVIFAPRLPWEWDEIECLDMPVMRGGELLHIHAELRHERWKRTSTIRLHSDKPIGNLRIRFGPYPRLMPARAELEALYGPRNVITNGNSTWVWLESKADLEWCYTINY